MQFIESFHELGNKKRIVFSPPRHSLFFFSFTALAIFQINCMCLLFPFSCHDVSKLPQKVISLLVIHSLLRFLLLSFHFCCCSPLLVYWTLQLSSFCVSVHPVRGAEGIMFCCCPSVCAYVVLQYYVRAAVCACLCPDGDIPDRLGLLSTSSCFFQPSSFALTLCLVGISRRSFCGSS